MKKPVKDDVSRPRESGYDYKKRFYRSREVAGDYDNHRFGSPARRRRDTRKWTTILAALNETEGVRTILDMPCGTGRFTGRLAERGYLTFGGDISHEMLERAAAKSNGADGLGGWLQADAERMPLRDASLDCVMSIRFMLHVDPGTRVRILREMRRVSRRWLIVDYRHRYSLRYLRWRLARALGLTDRPLERVSREQLEREFRDAGLSVRRIIPVAYVFSDKWIVVGESTGHTAS